jgi:hypothetical protein
MELRALKAFYYIATIANIESIMNLGILCYNKAKNIEHESIAMDEIQERRINVVVPDAGGKGKSLHDFVPLYFDFWNPMLSSRRHINEKICILVLDKSVIYIPGVVIADRNASKNWCKFAPAPEGLNNVDSDVVFARSWINGDKNKEYDNKGKKCAEILVPKLVPPSYIKGAYAASEQAAKRLEAKICGLGASLKIKIDRGKFF